MPLDKYSLVLYMCVAHLQTAGGTQKTWQMHTRPYAYSLNAQLFTPYTSHFISLTNKNVRQNAVTSNN